jgi:diphthine-ammonia ligase
MTYPPEPYLHHGHLIPEEHWQEKVAAWKAEAGDRFVDDTPTAREALHQAIVTATLSRANDHPRVGVLFSGGLDSSLLAAILHRAGIDVTCYTVGYQDGNTQVPADLAAAREVSEHLGVRLVEKTLDYPSAHALIEETARALSPAADAVKVGVGCVVIAASRLAIEDGVGVVFTGLGSEEIFAGYERHLKAVDVHAECWAGLGLMWGRDLVRDCALTQILKIKAVTPFLDPDVIVRAMRFSPTTKLGPEGGKLLLRTIAAPYLGTHAKRKKKAAQYGSAFQKALEKAARERGMNIAAYIASITTTGTRPPGPGSSPESKPV